MIVTIINDLSSSSELGHKSGNILQDFFRRSFSSKNSVSTPLDLIFLETYDMDLCFKKEIIAIGSLTFPHQFFDFGVMAKSENNFVQMVIF